MGRTSRAPLPIDPADSDRNCAFCPGRALETTPEIARLVREANAPSGWREMVGLTAEESVDASPAEFRLVPNLFEILSFDYWHLVHGWQPTPRPCGPTSVPIWRHQPGASTWRALARIRMAARAADRGGAGSLDEPLDEEDLEREAVGLFAGNHQVVVARRHFVDGARTTRCCAARAR